MIQVVSQVLPATHFMRLIKTLFLAGDNWPMVAREGSILALYACRPDRGVAPEPAQAAGLTAMRAMLDFIVRVAFLCRKELLVLLVKDPPSRALIVLPALLQSLLFGYGATYDLTNAPYAVLDQSRRRRVDAAARASRRDRGVPPRRHAATRRPRSPASSTAVTCCSCSVFPSDFEARLAAGQGAPLQMILDGRNSTTAGAAAGQVGAIVAAYNQDPGRRAADRRSSVGPGTTRTSNRAGTSCRR